MADIDTEQIVLLDDSWNPIGAAPKLASHNGETPLHLAFSLYVFNTAGEVLITQRAPSKKVWPDIWTNSCCGHPAPGEAMEAAIHRRTAYELGLRVDNLSLALADFNYHCEYKGIVENEFCPVYVARANSDILLNPEEVADYKWMHWNQLLNELKLHNGEYSYWCKLQIPLLEAGGFVPVTD